MILPKILETPLGPILGCLLLNILRVRVYSDNFINLMSKAGICEARFAWIRLNLYQQSLAKVSSSSIFRLFFSWFWYPSACKSAVQQPKNEWAWYFLPVTGHIKHCKVISLMPEFPRRRSWSTPTIRSTRCKRGTSPGCRSPAPSAGPCTHSRRSPICRQGRIFKFVEVL